MSDTNQRKKRILMTEDRFNQVKRLYKSKTKKELIEIMGISLNSLNEAIRKIEHASDDDPKFKEVYKKAGRKPIEKSGRISNILNIFGSDNSLTIRGCIEKLDLNISKSQVARDMIQAGLTRKRLKKKSCALLDESHEQKRMLFCTDVLGMRSRRILFLDESGFNLHTSANYGYSQINQDAVIYQPKSKGQNVSLCAIISCNGILHSKLHDGAYNANIFLQFLNESLLKGTFIGNPVLYLTMYVFITVKLLKLSAMITISSCSIYQHIHQNSTRYRTSLHVKKAELLC